MAGVAIVFPGQGSQSPGMGRQLYEQSPAARAVFATANDVLGYDLAGLCFDGSAEALQPTERAQPALLTVSVAAFAALRGACGASFRPLVAAGHSLGEFSAVVAAGSLSFPDALSLVQARGRLMQTAGVKRPGSMLAVLGLAEEKLRAICEEVGQAGTLVVANLNAPGQIVLSGEREAIEAAAKLARAAGARRALPLAVSGAFHSPLMQPAAEQFRELVDAATLADPEFPIVANSTAEVLGDAGAIRAELQRQLTAPVRWSESVGRMRELGAGLYIELGPGSVLCGLIRRTMEGAETLGVGDSAGLQSASAALAAFAEGG